MLIFLLIQGTPWVKVVDTTTKTILLPLAFSFDLPLVVIVTSHIRHKIPWPSEKLLNQAPEQSGNRRLLHYLANFMYLTTNISSILLSSFGYENHISRHI